jgi:hypothetical protein
VRNKYLRHLISVIVGTIAIYLLMQIDRWIFSTMTDEERRELEHVEISDLFIIGLFFLIVATIQFIIVIPLLDYLKRKDKITKRKYLGVGGILTIAPGLSIGLKLGTFELGYMDVIQSVGLWVFIFGLFYLTNFLTLKKIAG